MKFKLRKISGAKGTEVKISVLFSPEETDHGLCSVRDDENIHLDLLKPRNGDEFQSADYALMLLRSLCHYADLWDKRNQPGMSKHITRGVKFMELRIANKKRKRGKK